jgi:O-antigen/teichoic acid export membrane protein
MRNIVVITAGILMLLASVAHGLLGWPALRAELVNEHASPELISGLAAGWLWGSACMLTFGAIVTISGVQMRRGNNSGALAARAIALCFLAFGLLAFVLEGFDPHFLIFVVLGLLAAASFLRRSRSASIT